LTAPFLSLVCDRKTDPAPFLCPLMILPIVSVMYVCVCVCVVYKRRMCISQKCPRHPRRINFREGYMFNMRISEHRYRYKNGKIKTVSFYKHSCHISKRKGVCIVTFYRRRPFRSLGTDIRFIFTSISQHIYVCTNTCSTYQHSYIHSV